MNAERIEHVQNRADLTLVQRDEDVQSIKAAIGADAPDIDGLFVAAKNGELTEVYGFSGVTPLLSLPLVRLL